MIKNCFNCAHSVYIGQGDYICDLDMTSLIIEEFSEPTKEFFYCKGEGWKAEE